LVIWKLQDTNMNGSLFFKKGEALYLLNNSKYSPQRIAQHTVTVTMSSTSLQSTFLHEGSQLEKNIIILQYSAKADFYHRTGIYLQYSHQSHLCHVTWYILGCSLKLRWIFSFCCDHSYSKGYQGFVMFLLGHIRLNKNVCSLDGTEAHIHLHYVHRQQTLWM